MVGATRRRCRSGSRCRRTDRDAPPRRATGPSAGVARESACTFAREPLCCGVMSHKHTLLALACTKDTGRHGAGHRQRRQAGRGRDPRAWGQYAYRRRLLRHSGKAQLARHLADCLGETPGPGGGGVSTRVPELWRRHPADRVHHRARTDPEDPHALGRTARATTGVARPWPAHRLGRTRADPRRSRRLSSRGRRTARDRCSQPLSGAGREVKPKPPGGRPRRGPRRPEKNATDGGGRSRSGCRCLSAGKPGTSLTIRPSARKCLWAWLRKCR